MTGPQWAHQATARALARGADPGWVHRMLDVIEARLDLADQRVMVVLALRLAGGDDLPAALREEVDRVLLGFRYSLDDPGDDSMCTWTENHQLMFAVGEYLVGQLHPEATLTHTGLTGLAHRDRARRVLLCWLEDRFRWGFSEWLSPTYYELDVAALTLLVEHAEDDELATRAAMVLDLLLLDAALHHFQGRFLSSSGRAYRRQKMDPARSEFVGVLSSAFSQPPLFDPQTLTGIFVARSRYSVPRVLGEIARAQGAHVIRSSHGRTPAEVLAAVASRHDNPRSAQSRAEQLRALWSMQAFTLPETITPTLEAFTRLRLERNRYLAPLGAFTRVPRRLHRVALRVLNPGTQGLALQRADVLTHRTPHHLLSSAQHYHPGEFGDQQHLWQAALPGGISVFGTHPGAVTLGSEARPATPSAWVGNGVNPDIGQVGNVLLVLHDLRVRRGYLEGRRHELSHVHVPFARFDETTISERVVTARKGDTFLGLRALGPIEMTSEDELLQRGVVTGWVVVLSDRGEFSSLPEFTAVLKASILRHRRDTLRFEAALPLSGKPRRAHRIELRWRGDLVVDGTVQPTDHPRYDTPWVRAPRGATQLTVTGREAGLHLDWDAGIREES